MSASPVAKTLSYAISELGSLTTIQFQALRTWMTIQLENNHIVTDWVSASSRLHWVDADRAWSLSDSSSLVRLDLTSIAVSSPSKPRENEDEEEREALEEERRRRVAQIRAARERPPRSSGSSVHANRTRGPIYNSRSIRSRQQKQRRVVPASQRPPPPPSLPIGGRTPSSVPMILNWVALYTWQNTIVAVAAQVYGYESLVPIQVPFEWSDLSRWPSSLIQIPIVSKDPPDRSQFARLSRNQWTQLMTTMKQGPKISSADQHTIAVQDQPTITTVLIDTCRPSDRRFRLSWLPDRRHWLALTDVFSDGESIRRYWKHWAWYGLATFCILPSATAIPPNPLLIIDVEVGELVRFQSFPESDELQDSWANSTRPPSFAQWFRSLSYVLNRMSSTCIRTTRVASPSPITLSTVWHMVSWSSTDMVQQNRIVLLNSSTSIDSLLRDRLTAQWSFIRTLFVVPSIRDSLQRWTTSAAMVSLRSRVPSAISIVPVDRITLILHRLISQLSGTTQWLTVVDYDIESQQSIHSIVRVLGPQDVSGTILSSSPLTFLIAATYTNTIGSVNTVLAAADLKINSMATGIDDGHRWLVISSSSLSSSISSLSPDRNWRTMRFPMSLFDPGSIQVDDSLRSTTPTPLFSCWVLWL